MTLYLPLDEKDPAHSLCANLNSPGTFIELMPQSATQFRKATQPFPRSDLRLLRQNVLKLPLQKHVLHIDLLDGFDFKNDVIIASFGLHVCHDGVICLCSAQCLENEFEVDRGESSRSWRPCAIVVFEELASMTAVQISGNQCKKFAMQKLRLPVIRTGLQQSERMVWLLGGSKRSLDVVGLFLD